MEHHIHAIGGLNHLQLGSWAVDWLGSLAIRSWTAAQMSSRAAGQLRLGWWLGSSGQMRAMNMINFLIEKCCQPSFAHDI